VLPRHDVHAHIQHTHVNRTGMKSRCKTVRGRLPVVHVAVDACVLDVFSDGVASRWGVGVRLFRCQAESRCASRMMCVGRHTCISLRTASLCRLTVRCCCRCCCAAGLHDLRAAYRPGVIVSRGLRLRAGMCVVARVGQPRRRTPRTVRLGVWPSQQVEVNVEGCGWDGFGLALASWHRTGANTSTSLASRCPWPATRASRVRHRSTCTCMCVRAYVAWVCQE
jgi:hypothetical protein